MPVRITRVYTRTGDKGETARQFATRVGAAAPRRGEAFARLTVLYERARFGDTALTEGEWRDVSQALAALATR
jgi:cob(I)alamin adenosyltransferase